jgi:hypothetical protein
MHANIGRPSGYSDDIAANICTEIAAGLSLRDIARKPEFPSERAIYAWLVAHEPFQQMYARAREQRVERWADEIIELADEPVPAGDNAAVQRARLRVDTRKWLMSKLAPRKYGDRVEHVIKTGNAADLTDDELARIALASAPTLLLTADTKPETEDSPNHNDTDDVR